MERTKRISRRQFGKLAGGAALAGSLAPVIAVHPALGADVACGFNRAQQAPEQPSGPKLKLSAKQEEQLKQAIERRDRQLARLRDRALPYDLEPAFVFRVREKSRPRARNV